MISAVRNFAITFGISLLVFGLLAWFLSSFAVSSLTGSGNVTEDSGATDTADTTVYDPFNIKPEQTGDALKDVKGQTFTMLFVGVNYEETTAEPVITEEPPLTGEPDDTGEPPSPPVDSDTSDTTEPPVTETLETEPPVTTAPDPFISDDIREPSTPHGESGTTDAVDAPAVPDDQHAAKTDKETESQQSAVPPLVQGSAFQVRETEEAEDEEDGFYTDNIFAESIVLVRMDKEREEVQTTALSKDTRIMVDGVNTTLADVLRDKGIEYFCQKITAMTGLEIDYYAVTPVASFVEIVDMVGGVTMEIDEAIDYREEKEKDPEETGGADKNNNDMDDKEEEPDDVFSLKLSAGEQKLSGETAVNLFYYMYEVKGDTSCLRTLRSFTRAFLSNMKNCTSESDAVSLFQQIEPLIDTNITESIVSEQIDFVLNFDKLESVDISYPGRYMEDGGEVYFNPDVAMATYQMMPYKQ